jgi:hypothetical protein
LSIQESHSIDILRIVLPGVACRDPADDSCTLGGLVLFVALQVGDTFAAKVRQHHYIPGAGKTKVQTLEVGNNLCNFRSQRALGVPQRENGQS